MPSPAVAIIDLGSNSIKILVARRGDDGLLQGLKSHTLDVRISAGIDRAEPRLSDSAMSAAIRAVQTLMAEAVGENPVRTVVVATSAVRDAVNGKEFHERMLAATGFGLRILTGEEEANLIGQGLVQDPTLTHLRDFYVADLGGGSLEVLTFRQRQVAEACSLPLGCVRLTERFIGDTSGPLTTEIREAIEGHVRRTLVDCGCTFSLPVPPAAVFTGGTITSARAILATQRGQTLAETPAEITVSELRQVAERFCALDLASRRTIPGLPPGRADVFPAALVTLLALASFLQLERFHHSLYNLRWGLAAQLLGPPPA